MRDHHKCSECDVQVTEENVQYKQYVQTLEFLFPTVAVDDEVHTAGQSLDPTDESESHIVITTLSGECTTIVYNPNQTILSLKDIVEQELKTPSNKQSLLYNDTELKVSFKLAHAAYIDLYPLLCTTIRCTHSVNHVANISGP